MNTYIGCSAKSFLVVATLCTKLVFAQGAVAISTLQDDVLKVAVTRDSFDDEYDSQFWIRRCVEHFAAEHNVQIKWTIVPF